MQGSDVIRLGDEVLINAIRKLDRMLKDQDRVEAWSRLAAGNAEAANLLKLLTKD